MEYTCSFSYNKKNIIFENTSFNFPDNKISVICGHNGEGKSTLLKCISGILPTEASLKNTWLVTANGTLIKYFTLADHLKVIGNKNFQIERLIKAFELENFINKPITKLSTGQCMLASIIMAIASDKEILLLDEPFGPLDPINAEKLAKVLKSLKKTVIITSHDLFLTGEIADKVIFIKNGKIAYEEENSINFEKLTEKYKEINIEQGEIKID